MSGGPYTPAVLRALADLIECADVPAPTTVTETEDVYEWRRCVPLLAKAEATS